MFFLSQAWLRPFSFLDSAFLVSLQVTLTLSQILWQGDRSHLTFWLHFSVFLTGFLPLLCSSPWPRVHSLSWCCWSQALLDSLGVLLKQHPCAAPPPSSWLLLTRASHFSGPGAETSVSPAWEGSRSLIQLAFRCIYCNAQQQMGAGVQTGAGCKLINICKQASG